MNEDKDNFYELEKREEFKKIRTALENLDSDLEITIIGCVYYTYDAGDGGTFHNVLLHFEIPEVKTVIPQIEKAIKEVSPRSEITLLQDTTIIIGVVRFI
jgi:hypothetical protein